MKRIFAMLLCAAMLAGNGTAAVAVKKQSETTVTHSLAEAPKCKGGYSLKSASKDGVTFYYQWEWNTMPLAMYHDQAAVTWMAFDSESQMIDATATYKTYVEYYRMSDGKFMYEKEGTTVVDEHPEEAGAVGNVTMSQEIGGTTAANGMAWAKKGYIEVKVAKVTEDIEYIKFGGVYGHSLFPPITPQILTSSGMRNYFHPRATTKTQGRRYYKITSDGSVERL